MNIVQKKLVEAYATLVMGKAMTEEEVPETKIIGGKEYPIRSEVVLEIARRENSVQGVE